MTTLTSLLFIASPDTAKAVLPAAETIQQLDPLGIGLTIIGYSVVFFVLAMVYFVFTGMAKLFAQRSRRAVQKKKGTDLSLKEISQDLSGEVSAAIATAIFLSSRAAHDIENTVLTIKRISRTYSPWSSKIYQLRKNPRD